jgi:hypothetical protein
MSFQLPFNKKRIEAGAVDGQMGTTAKVYRVVASGDDGFPQHG